MRGKPKLSSILLLIGLVAALLLAFNLWSSNQDLKNKNHRLSNTIEQMETVASEEKELFTKTESFLTDSMQGKSMDYFSERYKKEAQEIIDSEDIHQDGAISEMKEIDVFNISVRKQDKEVRVYAIYKVTLTGIEGEFVKPGDQSVLFLMSTIDWVKENGEYKVNNHTLEPLNSGEQVVKNITS
jgi:hypothetical protein